MNGLKYFFECLNGWLQAFLKFCEMLKWWRLKNNKHDMNTFLSANFLLKNPIFKNDSFVKRVL